jgi:hypothetical protein
VADAFVPSTASQSGSKLPHSIRSARVKTNRPMGAPGISRSVWSATGLPALLRLPRPVDRGSNPLAVRILRFPISVFRLKNSNVDRYLPLPPGSFALKQIVAKETADELPSRDWPHAPVHRLSEHGIYFITAGTFHKAHLLNDPAKLDLVECSLLTLSKRCGWQLEAWAILSNHYHFIARGAPILFPCENCSASCTRAQRGTSTSLMGQRDERYGATFGTHG